MLVAPLPSWKELFGLVQQNSIHDLLTSGSAMSIRLIIEGYRKSTQKEVVNIMLPDFFCAETENSFCDVNINLIRYPLDNSLEPDWNVIKSKIDCTEVDILIFVHYFGSEHDVSRARAFCDLNKIVLIEDCAHVLYGYGKMDKKSNFSIYSPHKYLPIPDGGIIKVNSNDDLTLSIALYIKEMTTTKSNAKHYLWRIKKSVLKLFHITKKNEFKLGPHVIGTKEKGVKERRISNYSNKILSNYSQEDLKEIAYKRCENLQIINEVLRRIDRNIRILTDDNSKCPLFGVYSLENISEPIKFVEQVKKIGLSVSFWPSINEGIVSLTEEFDKLTKHVITIPVHQSLNINKLAKMLRCQVTQGIKSFTFELLEDNGENKERWDKVLSKSAISNITQDWSYGDIKARTEGWAIKRYLFKDNDQDIGVVQLLIKKLGSISVAYRVNKGPIFISEYANIENEILAIDCIRKQNPRRPFLYVPYAPYTVDNLGKMVSDGWKLWNPFGFPTGEIELSLSEEQIRSRLESKWRNQLKTAEKRGYNIRVGFERFDEMLELYKEEQIEKGFDGVPLQMLQEMRKEPSPLKVFYVLSEESEIIAFDMFYIHSNAATYYIGWNGSEEGRRNYLNNLLLFRAAMELKSMGMKKLDLGGIEYIHTESVAKFKDGMNPRHFRQTGEFIKV